MKANRIHLVVCLASCALVVLVGSAHAGQVQQVPIGPRALAMGGAFSSIADDVTAIFWNPAGIPSIGHQEITGTHANLYDSDIQDDYVAFALPLARRSAVAIDWYHSGFKDPELNFGENRFDLAFGWHLMPKLSAGATLKYLTRDTSLDGVSVRRGKGAGLDFGLLATPLDKLHLALVAQDATNTKLAYSEGEGTVVAYPRTLRVAASYSPIRDGLIAVDLDDRLHVGAEYSPLSLIALRAGIQHDGDSPDRFLWSAGTGIRWSIFQFDYAYTNHPTLGGTSHFGLRLSFNFNPSQIRIERAEAHEIFTSQYKRYAHEPFGSIWVTNLSDNLLTAQVSVLVPQLMQQASTQEVYLRARATQEVRLTAIFPPRVLLQNGDIPAQAIVSTTYQSLHLPRTETTTVRFPAYGPGAIDWSQGVDQAAAFVTTRDPAVDAIAHEATRTVARLEGETFGIRNVNFAVALFDALGTLGVAYVTDPNNPYTTISGIPRAVDTVSYPRDTLTRRTGDCDDTSVLLAALLENVGVRAAFVGVPGHLFLLASTGVSERNQLALGLDENRYVVYDGEVWIPIETTALGKGFTEAWQAGMKTYRSNEARNVVTLVDITKAQSRYEPGDPQGAFAVAPIDSVDFRARLERDLHELISWRRDYMEGRYGDTKRALEVTAAALNEKAHVYFLVGRVDDARQALEQALAKEPGSTGALNNLANVEAAGGDFSKAAERYTQALVQDRSDPGVWLNLGLARYAVGDSAGADEAVAHGVELSGGYSAACALLGLAPEATTGKGAERMMTDEARQLLKDAPHRAGTRAPATSRGGVPKAPSRLGTGSEAERMELSALLYWKQ